MIDEVLGRRRIMNRRVFLKAGGTGVLALLCGKTQCASAQERPNIVWIIAEDMSCHFSYQGKTTIETPNVDRLAREGVVFNAAYVTCPVCSPSRSALVTGMYQTTIGAHNHRSFRGALKHHLPAPVRTIPEYFKEAGYYVCNGANAGATGPGKTDYNFEYPADLYDGADYAGRAPNQPFFMQFQLHGGKRRNAIVTNPVLPEAVTLPPYYPDDPVMRKDWAEYLNSVLNVDREVGEIMTRLKADGLENNTVVFFITDHGISHARGKQFLYEEGAHIPFIVWAPGRVPAGAVRDDFAAHIDLAATSMYFAGIPIPEHLESRPLFGPGAHPREFIISARDRCDETVERIRSVRKGRYTYIRNFYPERPHLQPNAYKDAKPILIRLRELYAEGKLAGHPAERLFTTPRPKEELYDRENDPWELVNLAEDPAHAVTLVEMRGIVDAWIKETGDKGQNPESDAAYDADMAVYLIGQKRSQGYVKVVTENIGQMKAWAAEGK
ncbi:MAG: sulfatase [Candidatus Hydrogenedentes bacterium]|nr:sulfatase [Candidatus Hydrogenedentota bacterium]